MTTTSLSSLADELFLRIVSFLLPPDLLSFARSHQRALNCSQQLLTKHQQWDSQYRIIHDRAPLFIPTLLRRGLQDPHGELWHVQRFESWGTRLYWSDWDTFDVNENDEDLDDGGVVESDDHTDLNGTYYDGEYEEAIREAMQSSLHFSDEETAYWINHIRDGGDEPLKGLMIALAPRTNTAVFVAHPHDSIPLAFLCQAISKITTSSPTPVWPPGFLSLTSLSIADYTTLQHPHDNFYCSTAAVVPFFSLPNLKELALQVCGYTDDEEEWELPVGSSSIEKLKIDCCDFSDEDTQKMILACRALKSIEVDSISFEKTLERLLAQSPLKDSIETVNGLPVKQWLARNDESQYPTPKVLSFVDDVIFGAEDGPEGDDSFEVESHGGSALTPNGTSIWLALYDLRNLIPPFTEKVRFELSEHRGRPQIEDIRLIPRQQPRIASLLLRRIVELVEDPAYANLKEVCIFSLVGVPIYIDEWTTREVPGMESAFIWDEALYKRIVDRGVDLHRPSRGGTLTREQQQKEYTAHEGKHEECGTGKMHFVHMTDPRLGHPRHAGRVFPEMRHYWA